MDLQSELARLARNFGPALVTYAVAKGYVPAEFAGPITELAVAVIAGGISWGFSIKRDKKRAKAS